MNGEGGKGGGLAVAKVWVFSNQIWCSLTRHELASVPCLAPDLQLNGCDVPSNGKEETLRLRYFGQHISYEEYYPVLYWGWVCLAGGLIRDSVVLAPGERLELLSMRGEVPSRGGKLTRPASSLPASRSSKIAYIPAAQRLS